MSNGEMELQVYSLVILICERLSEVLEQVPRKI